MKRYAAFFILVAAVNAAAIILPAPAPHRQQAEIPSESDADAAQQPTGPIVLGKTTLSNYLTNISQIGLLKEAGAINCVVVSNTDSNLMLAGANNGGVWRSTNRGASWTVVDDYANSLIVASIAQNKFKPNEFYYCHGIDIYQGSTLLYDIYRSTDAGLTFTNVIASAPSFGRLTKIVPSTVDSNTVYFSQFTTPLFSGGSIWRTTDNFATFEKVFQGNNSVDDIVVLPGGEVEVAEGSRIWKSPNGALGSFVLSNTGIASNVTRIKLTVCTTQPLTQYACAGFGNISGNIYGMYRSLNGGSSWTFMDTVDVGLPLAAAVKPDNPNFVICGSVNPHVSLDGGATWQNTQGGYDIRSFLFDPLRPGLLFVTSDFGISSLEVAPITSTSFTNPKSYDSTLNTQEVYNGDYFATGTRTVMGFQDLGSRLVKSSLDAVFLQGGDGGYARGSKQDSGIGYYSVQGGKVMRSSNLEFSSGSSFILNQLDADNNFTIDEGAMFIHPYLMNNADDKQLYYPTFKRLWRSTNSGTTWTPVSDYYHTDYRVAITGSDKPDPIVYWSNDDSIFVLPNAASAPALSEMGIPGPGSPQYMAVDPDNDSFLYFIKEGFTATMYHSSNFFNGPVSWTDLSVNFPSTVSPMCIAAYPGNNQVLFAGSYQGGLYISIDGGQSWDREEHFPFVQIREIKIRPSDHKLFIFTYGRGIWTAEFFNPNGVSSLPQENDAIKPFPNPFTDKIRFSAGKAYKDAEVTIMALNGTMVFRKQLDIDGSTAIAPAITQGGVYILTVRNKGVVITRSSMVRL